MLSRITRGPFQRRFTAGAAACIGGSHLHLQPQHLQQDSLRACFAALPRETSALRLRSSSSVPSRSAALLSSQQELPPAAEPKGASWYQHPYPRAAELEKVVGEKQQRITELEAELAASKKKRTADETFLSEKRMELGEAERIALLNSIAAATNDVAGIRADIAAAKNSKARSALASARRSCCW